MIFQLIKDILSLVIPQESIKTVYPKKSVKKVRFDENNYNNPTDILDIQYMDRSLDVYNDKPCNIQSANQNKEMSKTTQYRNQYNYQCEFCSQYIGDSLYMYLDNTYCSINCRTQKIKIDRL